MMKLNQFQDWTICEIKGRIDSFNILKVEEDIARVFHDGSNKIALNITEVEFLNMPMIRYLIEFNRLLLEKQGELGIIGPNPTVAKHLDIYASRTELRVYKDMESFERNEVLAFGELYKHCSALGL